MRYKKKNISIITAKHVFISELDARYDTILHLISISRKLRRASNVLTGIMQKKFVERAGALICKEIKTGNDGKAFTSCDDCIKIAVRLVEEELGL